MPWQRSFRFRHKRTRRRDARGAGGHAKGRSGGARPSPTPARPRSAGAPTEPGGGRAPEPVLSESEGAPPDRELEGPGSAQSKPSLRPPLPMRTRSLTWKSIACLSIRESVQHADEKRQDAMGREMTQICLIRGSVIGGEINFGQYCVICTKTMLQNEETCIHWGRSPRNRDIYVKTPRRACSAQAMESRGPH